MKLNYQQLQFIDKFLLRNDVIFADIRAEMIDHIATGIEEKLTENDDFYFVFKNYVNANRKEIFAMNKEVWRFTFPELKKYFKFIANPKMLFFFGFVLFSIFLLKDNSFFEYFKNNFPKYFLRFIMIFSFGNIIYFWMIKRKRYFFIDKLNIVLMILFYINIILFDPFTGSDQTKNSCFGIFICLCLGYVFYVVSQLKKFFKFSQLSNENQ